MGQRMNAPVTPTEKRTQNPTHETNQDRSPKCAPETVDVKPVHEVVHQEEHEAVHDEDENPQGEND
jgi:hypothetical protein